MKIPKFEPDQSLIFQESLVITEREILIRTDHECRGYVGETNNWSTLYSLDLHTMTKTEINWRTAKDIYNALAADGYTPPMKKELWAFIRPISDTAIAENSASTEAEIMMYIV